LKKVSVVKSFEVEVKPFVLEEFTRVKESAGSMKNITKKMLKQLADELELEYDDKQISFTKKLMTVYLEKLR
jgi:hypothetical protein